MKFLVRKARPIKRREQSGVALLTAVMVTTFAATIIAGLMVAQNLSIHRATNMRSADAAWWYLIGLEEWASTILRRDAQDSAYDGLDELWAMPIDFLPVDEGVLAGRIVDLNGRFNLNSLAGASLQKALPQFQRLLAAIPELAGTDAMSLGAQIADWIDEDAEPRPQGAEDEVYLALEPPRRAANLPLVSVTELRLMPEMTPDIYKALEPHVAAYPAELGILPINVNSVTPPVLQSLSAEFTPADIESLLAVREQGSWESIDAFNAEPALAARAIEIDIDVSSTLFQAEGTAQIDGVRMHLTSILHRGSDGKARVLAHSRSPL